MNEKQQKTLGISLFLISAMMLCGVGLQLAGVFEDTAEGEDSALSQVEITVSYEAFYNEILGLMSEFMTFNEHAAVALHAYSENPNENKQEYQNTLVNAMTLMEKASQMTPPSDMAEFYTPFATEATATKEALSLLQEAVETGADFTEIAMKLSESSANLGLASADLLNALFEKL